MLLLNNAEFKSRPFWEKSTGKFGHSESSQGIVILVTKQDTSYKWSWYLDTSRWNPALISLLAVIEFISANWWEHPKNWQNRWLLTRCGFKSSRPWHCCPISPYPKYSSQVPATSPLFLIPFADRIFLNPRKQPKQAKVFSAIMIRGFQPHMALHWRVWSMLGIL